MKNLKEKLNKKLGQNGGFTLMEMLIVVAIIAILIAIAIPTFSGQLEQAREGVDAANIRSEYAKVMMEAVLNPETAITGRSVDLQQQKADWQKKDIGTSLLGLATSGTDASVTVTVSGTPSAKGTATFEYKPATTGSSPTDATLTITIS